MISSRIAVLIAIVVSFASLGAAQEQKQAEAGGAPKLVVESTAFDFGTVKSGTPITHTFKIKNDGKGELQIKSVAPS